MINRLLLPFFAILLCAAGAAGAQSVPDRATTSALDATEQQLVAAIDRDEPAARDLLKRVVEINSGTMNFDGVRAVGKVFQSQFDALGMETRWIDGEAFGRAGHLWAGHGDRGPKLLLIGHLDTVFAVDSPFQDYTELEGDRVKGPGITDMKGGNVIIVYVLRALKDAGVLEKLSVQVVLAGDEELRGKPHSIANRVMIDAAKWADIALGFEDGDGDPETAVVSRRGATSWELVVTGRPAHSSQIFRDDLGYGAIFETARILDGFRTALASEPNLTFNPGVIVGGTDVERNGANGTAFGKANVIARATQVKGDIRALSPEQLSMAQDVMRKIVADNLAHTEATLTFLDGYPPMPPSKGNHRLLGYYNQASEDLGFGTVRAVDPRRAGAADISFAAAHVDMALDGLGLMGEGGHTDNEIADMATLAQNAKRAAVLVYRLQRMNSRSEP
ncbi:MAG: M20/M25/M40 family metallo-hydrolase [Pseudomonadota bacterium]